MFIVEDGLCNFHADNTLILHIKDIQILCSHSYFLFLNKYCKKKNTLICNRIIFFSAIDPVCYKLAKENRRKEEPTTNKTSTFSTINSTQNGYGFKLVCYYLY